MNKSDIFTCAIIGALTGMYASAFLKGLTRNLFYRFGLRFGIWCRKKLKGLKND